jgi:hypothetical protein
VGALSRGVRVQQGERRSLAARERTNLKRPDFN